MTLKSYILMVALAISNILTANPLALPEYTRELHLTFQTPEAAKEATLTILPLPEGKRFAFSTRWDGNNPKHVQMAALLAKYGFKGTFFLVAGDDTFYSEILPHLTRNGHSVGSHTLNHPNLATLIPNEVARQILQNRAEYEARTDQPVNAFVLPYGAYQNGSDTRSPLRIGEALYRAGELGSPEYDPDIGKKYGFSAESWSVSSLFSLGDPPSEEAFDREIEKRLTSMTPKDPLHATFTLHTWQDEKLLDAIFSKYANRSDWWYCNENEYNAYRYAAQHTRIEKRLEENRAIFRLTGPTPAALGSDTPLWAAVTPATADGETQLKLPHTLALPEKIDLVVTNSSDLVKPNEFPTLAVSLQMNLEEKRITLMLANQGNRPLTNISVAFRLPLLITTEERVPRKSTELIAPDSTVSYTVPFTELRKTALYQCGKLFAAAEVDFELDETPQRLWVATTGELRQFAEAVPRDTALALGPLPPESFTQDALAAASNPQESLSNWTPLKAGEWNLPHLVQIPKEEKKQVAVSLTFRAETAADNWKLHVGSLDVLSVYLNGSKIEVKSLPELIRTRQGLNRLVVLYQANGGPHMISVSKGRNPNLPVEFLQQ